MLLNISELICLSVGGFAAAFLWSIVGFGSGIIYLLCYQLFDFTGIYDHVTLKYAVLTQSFVLIAGMTYMFLVKFRDLQASFHVKFMVPLAITELLMVQVGAYFFRIMDESFLRLIIGVVVLSLATIKLVRSCLLFSKAPEKDAESKTSLKESDEKVAIETGRSDTDLPEKIVENQPEFHLTNSLIIYGLIAAAFAGFSTGLIGIKGPPYIIIFLIIALPKQIVRCTGMFTSLLGLAGRLWQYTLEAPPTTDWPIEYQTINGTLTPTQSYAKYNQLGWFIVEDWPVYVSIMGCTLLGVLFGSKMFDKVQAHHFEIIMLVLLFACGVSMITKTVISGLYAENNPDP